MPIATPDRYVAMLDRAKEGGFAYPAINVTSSQTLNAALQGFAEADSDGIIQVSLGTALYLSGNRVQNRLAGSKALALYAHEVASHYSVTVALHTDHCPAENLDDWVRPLLPTPSNVAATAWTRCINHTCGTGPRSRSTKTCASQQDCWSRR
jgi:fructose-bisphosphate aldolase class II